MPKTINYTGNVWRGGKSSVNVVRISGSFITIWFRDQGNSNAKYRYQRSKIGRGRFNRMKELAQQGKGLNRYIHNQRIKGERR